MAKKPPLDHENPDEGEIGSITAKSDPYRTLISWLADAEKLHLLNPTAMVLATADSQGTPSARVLLLKEVRPDQGLVFYTNYLSPKGRDLAANPLAAINFYWDSLGRQVRIRGRVKKISKEESEAYWSVRPFASRVSQYVSKQSEVIESREELEARYLEVEGQFAETQEVPCPTNWGGYILEPTAWEYWIADPVRFHYRYLFERTSDGWSFKLLSP